MAAYVLFIREGRVQDAAELAEYQRKCRETPSGVRVKPLIVYGAMEALEGEAPDGMVLLEFSNSEEARAWYNSRAYQAALPHRKNAADYRAILVEGL